MEGVATLGEVKEGNVFSQSVSPEDVTFAKKLFTKSRKKFRFLFLGYIALCIAYMTLLPVRNLDLVFQAGDGLRLISILFSMYSLYRWGIPYAGRLFAIVWGIACFTGFPDGYWSDSVYSIQNIQHVLPAVVTFLAGWLMDVSIRTKKLTMFCMLLATGVLHAAYAFLLPFGKPFYEPRIFSLAGSVAFMFIAVFRNGVIAPSLNDEILREAWKRMNDRVVGQIIAIILSAMPIVFLINALSVPQQFDSFSNYDVIHTPRYQGVNTWFWSRYSELITEDLLSSRSLFGVYGYQFKNFSQNDLCELIPQSDVWRIDQNSFHDIEEELKNNATMLLRMDLESDGFTPKMNNPHLVLLEVYQEFGNQTRYFVNNRVGEELIPLSRLTANESKYKVMFLVWPLIALGLLGFILLWQQGGSNWSVFLVGMALIAAVGEFGGLKHFFFPCVQFETWLSALHSLAGGASYRMLVLIQQIGYATNWIARNGFLASAVLASLFSRKRNTKDSAKSLNQVIQFTLNFLIIHGVMLLLRLLLESGLGPILHYDSWTPFQEQTVLGLTVSVLSVYTLSLIVLSVRHSIAGRKLSVSDSGAQAAVTMLFLAVAASSLATLTIHGLINLSAHPVSLILSISIMFFEIVLGMYVILKWNDLHILDSRGLSNLLLVAILPVVIEVIESVSGAILAAAPFFVSGGAGIVSIVVAVAILSPMQKKINSIVRFAYVPGLKTIENAVMDTIERLADSDTIDNSREIISSLLTGDKLGLTEYAYYYRQGRDRLSLLMETLPGDLPETIEISDELWRVLSMRMDFIDFESAKYSTSFYFEKFELEKLFELTKSRFLLPVNHGRCLMGLLFLPEQAPAAVVDKQPVAELIGRVVTHVSRKG